MLILFGVVLALLFVLVVAGALVLFGLLLVALVGYVIIATVLNLTGRGKP